MKKIDKQLNRILTKFNVKHEGLKSRDYKSFSGMRRVEKKYTIKLMFGYTKDKNRTPIYSEALEVASFNTYIEIQKVLDYGLSKDVIEDDVFDGIEEDEEFE